MSAIQTWTGQRRGHDVGHGRDRRSRGIVARTCSAIAGRRSSPPAAPSRRGDGRAAPSAAGTHPRAQGTHTTSNPPARSGLLPASSVTSDTQVTSAPPASSASHTSEARSPLPSTRTLIWLQPTPHVWRDLCEPHHCHMARRHNRLLTSKLSWVCNERGSRMVIGRRLARAGAITVTAALAGIVGVSSATANPIPPKGIDDPGRHGRTRARAGTGGPDVRQRPVPERLLVAPARTGSAARSGSSRTSTPTATARRTACTPTTRCPRRPRPTA